MRKWLTPQNIIGFVSIVSAGLFWLFTMNGIPKKVEKKFYMNANSVGRLVCE